MDNSNRNGVSKLYVIRKGDGRPQIDTKATFCGVLRGKLPSKERAIADILQEFKQAITAEDDRVSGSAINNANGTWFEWLLAMIGVNTYVTKQKGILPIKLPNIARFDSARLYKEDLFKMIVDLRKKVKESSNCLAPVE